VLVYCHRSRARILAYVQPRAVALVTFCGLTTDAHWGKPDKARGELLALGAWGIGFTGRTQREAIMHGELPWWQRAEGR
jgi:hypothetical protein